ncbi:putative tonB protein [Colwellia psychrerythraea 34H]|uniref:Protein TonB n=2 Tax=Colwellia psychrerythraea TaxID=28229 RepID=Q484D5_COLP3|nr:putative tonB protein [Colwellia psychrerythraea 34H]
MKLTFASPLANKNTKNNQQSPSPEVLHKPPEPIHKTPVLKAVATIKKQVKHLVSVSVQKPVPVKKVEIELAKNNNNTKPNENDVEKNNEATTIENSSELSHPPSLVKSTNSVERKPSTGVESALQLYMTQVRDYIAKHKRYPKEAKIRRHQGRVSISFIIDADGRVSESKIVKSCKSRYINKSVKVLLSKLRFKVAPKTIRHQFPKTILLEVNYQFS